MSAPDYEKIVVYHIKEKLQSGLRKTSEKGCRCFRIQRLAPATCLVDAGDE